MQGMGDGRQAQAQQAPACCTSAFKCGSLRAAHGSGLARHLQTRRIPAVNPAQPAAGAKQRCGPGWAACWPPPPPPPLLHHV